FFERLLIPPFVYFFHLLYPFREVGRRSSATAAAAGGCVLVRTSTFVECGSFEAMRDALIDDVAMGRMLKDADGQLWLGFDPEVSSIRSYRGLGELWQMVARSAFVQLRFSYSTVVGVVGGLALFFCGPPVFLALGGVRLAQGDLVNALACSGFGAAAWLVQATMLRPYVEHHRCPRRYAFGLALASALYGGMTLTSAWNHLLRRGSSWKGRGDAP
ncbi:MAG: glycosyltransferase, partial [Acidobacteriota bacterium]|nr:glycosyltransferase [Acidobacteriota bacterium]